MRPSDWGDASVAFDNIRAAAGVLDLATANEAETRFHVIDRVIREVLGWEDGQIRVEEGTGESHRGYVDYVLASGDRKIVIEAKRLDAAFPTPTKRSQLRISGAVMQAPGIGEAIAQVQAYAVAKSADVAVVTNGECWCYYSVPDRSDDTLVGLLFPFDASRDDGHLLYDLFSAAGVENDSLSRILVELPRTEDRLLSVVRDADGRVDRNNLASHLAPALDQALYADALMANVASLERCFVSTEARSKFDALLGVYLADQKPATVEPARRIRKDKTRGNLEELVAEGQPSYAPPVTLIIGPVGAGKTTYLRHFELISGKDVLEAHQAHWIYADFESLGQGGDPRAFIYRTLRDYLLGDHPGRWTDYKHLVGPAYEPEIAGLARGPFAPIYANKEEFNKRVADHIQHDFDAVEPYVDKIFRHLAGEQLCILVLDNVDLYEDESLETRVFAEGLALSKRLHCHVIVSLRDKTFVKHRTESAFDAYELRKLWLDPPPFKAVLSARLTYGTKILEGRNADVELANGMHLAVPNLAAFIDIVQRSILQGPTGDFIDSLAGGDIRKGLTLATNFLTSGHVQADRAIKNVIDGGTNYYFPFHEVFKGAALAQWRHFKEGRADVINMFDSRLGSKRLRLLRLMILNFLVLRARREDTMEVPVAELAGALGEAGASEEQVVSVVSTLARNGLVKESGAGAVGPWSFISVSRAGAYYAKVLAMRLPYLEECMLDTAIDDGEAWATLSELTWAVEHESRIAERMDIRVKRVRAFVDYLRALEEEFVGDSAVLEQLRCVQIMSQQVRREAAFASRGAHRHH